MCPIDDHYIHSFLATKNQWPYKRGSTENVSGFTGVEAVVLRSSEPEAE